jgi:hypothetical protein
VIPKRVKQRLRYVLLVGVGVCFVVSIPWYRSGGAESRIWMGLPDWVAVALLCYVAAAVLNGAAWMLTDVSDRVDDDREGQ